MFIGEGTKGLIYQAVMLKPPNIQPVFPLRDESVETRTSISLGSKTGPVVIFNAEVNPKSLLAEDYGRFMPAVKS